MNIPLLRKIIKAIHAEPRRFSMGHWLTNSSSVAPCGTSACIAGYAVILSQVRGRGWHSKAVLVVEEIGWDLEDEGKEFLDLTNAQADRLFFSENWPAKFRNLFANAESPTERAKVAIARINHFIRTGQ